ncbi:MAG: hypothetical protein LUG86_09375 [Oscillospiraceae bacterium]|nr:hypothetical protein [Oscillospiraceae bacterium]
MTLNQAADQIYNLSLGGYFNREKFTADGWRRHVNVLMRHPETLKIHNTLVQEIALEDGHWLFTISYIPSCKGDGRGEYGWAIPETREEEQRLKERLVG